MKKEIDRYESEQLDRLSSQFKENFYVKDNILYAQPDKHDKAYATLTKVYNAMMYSVMIPRESNKILLPGTKIDDKTGRVYFKRGDDSDVYQYMVGLTNGTKGPKGPKESTLSKVIGAIKSAFSGAKRATTKYAPVVALAIVGTLATPTAQANEPQKATQSSKTKTERPSRRLQNDKTPKMFQKYKTVNRVKDKRLANDGR